MDVAQAQFRLADPGRRLAAVRLWQEVGVPADRLDLTWCDGLWRLDLPRPPVPRMEYLFELTHPDGCRELVPDPANPQRVATAFGDHSVVTFPGYVAPAWLGIAVPDGDCEPFEVAATTLGRPVTGTLWTAPGLVPSDAAPLLVVHDGPEYDALAGLTRYLAACVADGAVPPLRAALLDPGDRDRWYAAHPGYAAALAGRVLPALRARHPVTVVVGAGTSLGALAWLDAHRRHPDVADGLFLQSGSFFTPELDPQESWFPGFCAIVTTVRAVHTGEPPGPASGAPGPPAVRRLPVAMTCGTVEENLANNRLLAASLAAQGYPVTLTEVRDAHNYTAWRDAFDPDLARLVRRVVETGTD